MKKATALLVVMMIVAGLITVVFGAQRVALVQYNQSTAEEDSLYALYAAKAGIQDGLLRYRTERNASTSIDAGGIENIFRFDLTSGQSVKDSNGGYIEVPVDTPITKPTSGNYNFSYKPNHQIYDLKISYKAAAQGNPDLTLPTALKINVGQKVELSGFPPDVNGREYYLRYIVRRDAGCAADGWAQMEVYRVSGDGTVYGNEQIQIPLSAATPEVDSKNTSNVKMFDPAGGSLSTSVRLRAYNCSVRYYLATTMSKMGAGGQATDPQFDSQKTTVISSGYYGKAKKTLVAQINRLDGQLLGVYDYNIYAGSKIGQ